MAACGESISTAGVRAGENDNRSAVVERRNDFVGCVAADCVDELQFCHAVFGKSLLLNGEYVFF